MKLLQRGEVCAIPTALDPLSLTSDAPSLPSLAAHLIGTSTEETTSKPEPYRLRVSENALAGQTDRQATSLACDSPGRLFDDHLTTCSHGHGITPMGVKAGCSVGSAKGVSTASRVSSEDHERGAVVGTAGVQKRWEGWDTTTTTVFVTDTKEVPSAITISTTYGENPVVNGGTTVETIYKGASTLTVLGPSYLTLTFYPTSTTWHTSKTTIPTATATATKKPARPQAQQGSEVCQPGDADVKEKTGLVPTHNQSITLYVIAIYIIGIAIGWNLFILRDLLYPFKVLTVAIHEMGHVFATIILGYRIGFFSIDPKLGGATQIYIGEDREHPLPFAALPAGYVFSIFIGGVLTFCGFNTLASKIASFIIGLCWIAVFLRVQVLAKLMTIGAAGLMVGLWFVDHAWPLRLYVLFCGVMISFYVLWDAADDAFFAKQYPCCPALFYQRFPSLNPGLWTLIWFLISFLFFIGFVLAGLATWKQSDHAMRCQADTFLPT